MMRYIDCPVSPMTGVPDIRIPLYTIQSGDVTAPIDLLFNINDYTRANQLPGIIGAGWSLSCDYQVSRIVNGLDDFSKTFVDMSGMASGPIDDTPAGLKTWERTCVLDASGPTDTARVRWFFHDLRGRLVQICETMQRRAGNAWTEIPGSETRTTYEHDFADNITAVMESSPEHTLHTRKTLDPRGHALAENTMLDGAVTAETTFAYDGLWNLTELSSGAISEQFSCNIQGWATGHAASASGNAIYADALHYYDSYRSASPSRAGNVKGQVMTIADRILLRKRALIETITTS